jgi:hypothetical protein
MKHTKFNQHIHYGIFGLLLGIVLSFTGFSDFTEIHKMFTFQDTRLFYVFFGAILFSIIGFEIFKNRIIATKSPFSKNYIFGAVLFGAGWAICGACPSIALIQFGEGKLSAGITIFGIFTGVWIFRKLTISVFNNDTGVCGEEY